jgi:pyruvate ferredoxin oxidoreductase beta subunit
MEGLQEMRDSERPTERFAYKEFVSDDAKKLLEEIDAKQKEAAAARKIGKQAASPATS